MVITIIVILILAGVTVATLTGENGLLAKAQLAKERTIEAEQNENETLSSIENEMSKYGTWERTGENGTVTISETEYNRLLRASNAMYYSTDQEQEVGTWIDGKTIYQKTITGLNISLSWVGTYHASAQCTQLVEDVEQFVYAYGLPGNHAGIIPIMLNKDSSDSTKWNICSFNDVSLSGIIIQYTKTPSTTPTE